MNYTNKRNFPQYVVEWLEKDDYDYDENTLSATTLMQPPRSYALKKQNWDKVEIDIEDLIASRYGTAIHDSVEKVHLTGCKQEERLKQAVKNKIITGKYDILRQIDERRHELIDVKSTSVWTYIYGSKTEEYVKQLSIYRWLAIQNKYDVSLKAKVWMIFTDWSAAKAKSDPNYPQTRIVIKPIDLWGDEITLKYIGKRMDLLANAANLDQAEMPKCTDEELWASEETWAIMKDGGKRAIKVHKTEEKALEQMKELTPAYHIDHRKGKVVRCKYCVARKFCTQYTDLIAEGRSEDHDKI